MRFCPILTFREMNIMIGHAIQPVANVLVSFMFGLRPKLIGLTDEIGALGHVFLRQFAAAQGDTQPVLTINIAARGSCQEKLPREIAKSGSCS